MELLLLSKDKFFASFIQSIINDEVELKIRQDISRDIELLGSKTFATILDIQLIKTQTEFELIKTYYPSSKPLLMFNSNFNDPQELLNIQQSFLSLFTSATIVEILPTEEKTTSIQFVNGVVFDIGNLCLINKDQKIPLTNLEARILLYLSNNGNKLTKKEELIENAELTSNSSLYVHMTKLRMKIENDPKNPSVILNKRKEGYLLLANS